MFSNSENKKLARADCQGRLKSVNGRLVYKTPHTCTDVVKCELNKAVKDLEDKVVKFTTIPIESLYDQQRKQFQLLSLFNISFPDYNCLKDTLEKRRQGIEENCSFDESLPLNSSTYSESVVDCDVQSPKCSSHEENHISVRWDNYATNLRTTIPDLLQDEKFVDVTLACDRKYVKCHKVVLGLSSTYFKELLSVNPCKHPIILMRDFEFWELQAIVEFMYRGVVYITQDKLPRLLQVAELLRVKGLTGLENEMECDENASTLQVSLDGQPAKVCNKNKRRKFTSLSSKCKTSSKSENLAPESPTEPPEKLSKISSQAVSLKAKVDVIEKENSNYSEDVGRSQTVSRNKAISTSFPIAVVHVKKKPEYISPENIEQNISSGSTNVQPKMCSSDQDKPILGPERIKEDFISVDSKEEP